MYYYLFKRALDGTIADWNYVDSGGSAVYERSGNVYVVSDHDIPAYASHSVTESDAVSDIGQVTIPLYTAAQTTPDVSTSYVKIGSSATAY